MHEPMFSACLRGAAAVLTLTRATLDAAGTRRGKDAALAYPDTAYELPLAFGLTDLRVATLADAGKVLDLAGTLVRDGATAENALDAGAATLLAADVLGALSHEKGNPYPPPAVGFVPDSTLRKLGIYLVDGSVPGVAVLIGKATDPEAAAAMVRQFQEIGRASCRERV